MEPGETQDGSSHPYGLGWSIEQVNGRRMVYHTGNRPTFSGVMMRFLDDQLTVIILTNRRGASPSRIARRGAAFYVPALAPRFDQPIADPEPEVTAMLRNVLLEIRDGTVDAAAFTPEEWKEQYPAGFEDLQRALQPFGELRSFQLTGREVTESLRTYHYRALFGDTGLVLQISLTADDKIADCIGQTE